MEKDEKKKENRITLNKRHDINNYKVLFMDKKKARRKAIEAFLSGKQVSGRGTEQEKRKLTKEEIEEMESLVSPVSTKELRIRGRKKGKVTPRQTFRIDEALWRQFVKATRKKESKSASEVLRRFIYRYVHGK